jgi:menaquinone-dependent protoporphyrinogen oxidase
MRVLVASESRHGSTHEIARALGDALAAEGLTVEVRHMEDIETVYPYDAFVLGSAVYMRNWLHGARRFLDEHAELIRTRPTWLFSSGPIGSPPHPAASGAFEAGELMAETGAREHRLFSGKLDRHELNLTERAIAGALRVPAGDYRDWKAVTAWGAAIAEKITSDVPV